MSASSLTGPATASGSKSRGWRDTSHHPADIAPLDAAVAGRSEARPRDTLVVVDMQHVFGDPESPWFTPRFAEVLDPLDRLVAGYEPDVVWTRFVAPAEARGAWVDYFQRWPFAVQAPEAYQYRLIQRYADRPTLDLPTFGKWGPALAERVGASITVAGVSTDCCVLSTVLAAADAGVRVRVAAEACAGATDETHAQALAIMALYAPLVEVTSTPAPAR